MPRKKAVIEETEISRLTETEMLRMELGNVKHKIHELEKQLDNEKQARLNTLATYYQQAALLQQKEDQIRKLQSEKMYSRHDKESAEHKKFVTELKRKHNIEGDFGYDPVTGEIIKP